MTDSRYTGSEGLVVCTSADDVTVLWSVDGVNVFDVASAGPLRRNIDYNSVGRKTFLVDRLPDENIFDKEEVKKREETE